MNPILAACMALPVVTATNPSASDSARNAVRAEDATCIMGDLDIAGRYAAVFPDTGLSRGFELSRFRGEAAARFHSVTTRIAFTPARSGGDDGYVGIAGEAIVPVFQIAEARYDLPQYGLAVAGGLVDDIALMPVQIAWGHIAIARPLLTDQGLTSRSDLGGWASWTSPSNLFSATVSVTSGEGANRRERNDGVDTTVNLRVRPVQGLTVMAFGREGSSGLLSARNHRVGGAAWYTHPWATVGADGVKAWGKGGDGTLEPAGISVWAHAGPKSPVDAWARFDRVTDDLPTEGTGRSVIRAGAGPRLPFGDKRPAYLVAGWEGTTASANAASVAGGTVTQGTDRIFVQLGARLHGGTWVFKDRS